MGEVQLDNYADGRDPVQFPCYAQWYEFDNDGRQAEGFRAVCRYSDGGAPRLELSMPVDLPSSADLKLRVLLPTILESTSRSVVAEAVVASSRVPEPLIREDLFWMSPADSKFEMSVVSKRLTVAGIMPYLWGRNPVAAHTLLYLPRIAEIHTNFVESKRYLPLGPGVVIDTHHRCVKHNGHDIAQPGSSVLRLLSVLAYNRDLLSTKDIGRACDDMKPRSVTMIVSKARRYISENLPPEYGIETVSGVIQHYRLRRPEEI